MGNNVIPEIRHDLALQKQMHRELREKCGFYEVQGFSRSEEVGWRWLFLLVTSCDISSWFEITCHQDEFIRWFRHAQTVDISEFCQDDKLVAQDVKNLITCPNCNVMEKFPRFSELLYTSALSVFDNITPSSRKPTLTKEEAIYELKNIATTIDMEQAISYMNLNDGVLFKRMTECIQVAMHDVLKDSMIGVSDIPVVLKMIADIVVAVNGISSKTEVSVQIGRHTLIPIIEAIVLLSIQMLVLPSQFAVARGIVQMAFRLVSVNIVPLVVAQLKKASWKCNNRDVHV